MENFFVEDKFYSDLGDLCIDLDLDEEDQIKALPDDWAITAHESSLEPIFKFSVDWIMDNIDEERWSEDGDEAEKVVKALVEIDFDAVNAKIPKMYYGTNKKFVITKKDLLEDL